MPSSCAVHVYCRRRIDYLRADRGR
jgi:hypothetical protein